MVAERRLETARLAASRAGLVALGLMLCCVLAQAGWGWPTWAGAPVWWGLLALLLVPVTVAERWFGPLRAQHTGGLLLVLLGLTLGYMLEPCYLQAILEGRDAASLTEVVTLRLSVWAMVPVHIASLAACVAVPLTVLCHLRRTRAHLGWQLLVPPLLVHLSTLCGNLYYQLQTLYETRNLPAADVKRYGLEFDLPEFLDRWLVTNLDLTLPAVLACCGYALAAWWLERRAARAARAESRPGYAL